MNKLLAETLSVDPSALSNDLTMNDIENWNSLKYIELIVGLEELYGVQFTQDDVVEMMSVGAIRKVLQRHDLPAV